MLCLIIAWIRGTKAFIKNDPAGSKRYGFSAYISASRENLVPSVGYLSRAFAQYLRWSFHPERHGYSGMAQQVIEKLKAEQWVEESGQQKNMGA